MSKTKGNGINLSDTAEDMYGVGMSYSDGNILTGLDLLTDTTETELTEIKKELESGTNPMQFKKLMAFRIVEAIKGKLAAEKAEKHFQETIQNRQISSERTKISLDKLSARLIHLEKKSDPITIVSELQTMSKTQSRQLLRQGGVEHNGQKISDIDSLSLKIGDILKIGKRNWYEIC
jgi:tyrosyl-tRNA synthetase